MVLNTHKFKRFLESTGMGFGTLVIFYLHVLLLCFLFGQVWFFGAGTAC